MTTPFKALNPFTPRFIEVEYVAPDGGCCSISSSPTQQSFPDDPVPVEDNFQYLFDVPISGATWLLWVQDPITEERILVEEFLVSDAGILDITEYFRNTEIESIGGTRRRVFITRSLPSGSDTYEEAYLTSYTAETGQFSVESWYDVPEHEPLDGWASGVDEIQMVVIENYRQSQATFTISSIPPVLGPGSMMKSQSGSVWGRLNQIPEYTFTDFTIQFWVKLLGTPEPQNFGQYLGHPAAGNVSIYRISDGMIVFSAQNYLMTTSAGEDSALDTWVHWTFRIAGNVGTIFKNGTSIVSTPVDSGSFDFFGADHDLYFGQLRIPDNEQQLAFRICDFRMFTVGRTDEEVLADFEQRLTGDESGLIAYYPMHETDSVFTDYAGFNSPIFLKNLAGTGPSADIGWNADTPDCFV